MKKRLLSIGIIILTVLIIGLIFSPEKLRLKNYSVMFTQNGTEEEVWLTRVQGMKNKVVQYKLNKNIKEDFLLWMEDYFENPTYFEVHYVTNGIVSDRYMYQVVSYTMGLEGWTNFYKAVYDLKTGERVYLDDLFEISPEFISTLKLYGKEYTYDLGEYLLTKRGFVNESEEEIAEWIQRVAMTQEEWNEVIDTLGRESHSKPGFIITEDDLHLRVPIPLDKLEQFLKVPKWW